MAQGYSTSRPPRAPRQRPLPGGKIQRSDHGYLGGSPPNAFAAMTPAQVAQTVRRYVGGLPAPLTDPQIQARAQGLLDPVVQRITDQINARAKAGGDAVSGYTNTLAQNLAQEVGNVHTAYAPSEQATAASQSALADRLQGSGNAAADSLAARLASIGSPDVTNAAAADVRGTAAGSSNALYGTGIAALEQMIGNEANAKGYANKMPGIARLTGAQQLGQVQQTAQHDIADKTGQILDQLPSLVQDMRSNSDAARTNRSNAETGLFQWLTGRSDANAKFFRAEKDAGLNATVKARAQVQTAKIKSGDQAAKDAKPNAALSKTVGYVVDSNGNWIANASGKPQVLPGFTVNASGQVVKRSTGKKATAADLTPGERAALRKQAAHQAETYYYGVQPVTRADGSVSKPGVPALDYLTAVRRLMAQYSLSKPEAMQILNNYYAPGEDGRPKVDVDPSTNPRAAGPPAPKV